MNTPPTPGPWPWPTAMKASLALHAAAGAAALLQPAAWPWALGAVALNHAGLTAAGLWPRSRVLGPNVTRLPASAGAVWALTLDDGPDPEVTPRVLDLLDAHGVKATFFVIADRARQHGALLRDTLARGHDVQNHSRHHRHNFSVSGPKALFQEISAAQDTLAQLTGQRPHCFRAPAGLRNPLLDPVLHRLNLQLTSWTRRGFDTRDHHAPRVLNRLTRHLSAGDILLLHDGHAAHNPATGRPLVLDLLPPLLARCREAGLQAVTLRQALPPRVGLNT
jgi:peptidoglycan/xylan/chitin deacetylase (PgdA/CDA1 family)